MSRITKVHELITRFTIQYQMFRLAPC